MNVVFSAASFEDYQHWQHQTPNKLRRVSQLLQAIAETPFQGLGEPVPLQGGLQGYWSRRIDRVHRLVYRILDGKIQVLACRYRR